MCTLSDGTLVSIVYTFSHFPLDNACDATSGGQPLPNVRTRRRYAEQRRERDVDPRGAGHPLRRADAALLAGTLSRLRCSLRITRCARCAFWERTWCSSGTAARTWS